MTELEQPFAAAMRARRVEGPVVVPHIIGGKEYFEGPELRREDPACPTATVSVCHDAPDALVQEAVAVSRAAQRIWARKPLAERIAHVRKGIATLEQNLENWTLRLAMETGKSYAAARGEVVEVKAFIEVYTGRASEPDALTDSLLPDPNGLGNASVLRPYGVFAMITPFNYPFAQAAGPTIAAVLAGNGMVIKAPDLCPWSCQALHELMAGMDLPQGLVNIVHGGDKPGIALVKTDVDGIAFVGSTNAGNSIAREIANGPYPRPFIAEMGGKNPVIVTESADLELAAAGIVFSAFDLVGQKCSALSRVLVQESVHDQLVALVAEKAAALVISDPAEVTVFAGPVIDRDAFQRYQSILDVVSNEGLDLHCGGIIPRDGYFVKPAVIGNVPADHALATREHFLPVLTFSKVKDLDEALYHANRLDVGLTAGIYTGEEDQITEFLFRIEAGCVDVNVPGHACTGWWPGPQTFGGWKGSASTGKQGYGKWYIQQFAREQARKSPKALEKFLNA